MSFEDIKMEEDESFNVLGSKDLGFYVFSVRISALKSYCMMLCMLLCMTLCMT